MMELTLRNIRSIVEATLPLEGVSLVVGDNAAGKSTFGLAAAAALGGVTDLFDGAKKADTVAGMLRDGAERGVCQIDIEGARRRVMFAKGNKPIETVVEGAAKASLPTASPIALGVARLSSMPSKERADTLAQCLRTAPTREDIERYARDRALKIDVDALWPEIEAHGWDAVAKAHADVANVIKGAWKSLTHQAWGSKVGRDWMPEGFVEGDDPAELARKADKLAEQARQVELAASVDAAEIERLTAQVESAKEASEGKATLAADIKHARQTLSGLSEEDLRLQSKEHVMQCPHCKGALMIQAGKPVAAEEPTQADQDRRAELAELIQASMAEIDELSTEQIVLDQTERSGKEAQKRLIEIGKADASKSGDAAAMRGEAEALKRRADAAERYAKAQDYHAEIMRNLDIKAICAPDGIRQEKLGHVLDMANDALTELGQSFGIGAVEIGQNMAIRAGGRPYGALSESEKWRADLAIQIELAKREQAPAIVVDRFDVLAAHNRTPVVKELHALAKEGTPVLLLMTVGKKRGAYAGIVDLAAARMGETYLIENGHLHGWPVTEGRAAA